ncbi:hypothetical protein [Acinetobacter wanghuae]|uniref:hypothetical protein n=1 Tax=Acinetobacter wanghuae TaxID=2662362 RepID=UPI003AF7E7D1
MKFTVFTTCILSIFMMLTTQLGHAVVVKSDVSKAPMSLISERTSPIEKAIKQQKTEKNMRMDDNLKVLTSLKVAPSQNFFAQQNQRFSRFLQTIFS